MGDFSPYNWSFVINDIVPFAADLGTPRLLIPAPDDPRFAHLAWPKIARADDGTLIVAMLAGREHSPRRGECCPAISLSCDGGADFGEPRILVELGEGRPFQHSGNLAIGSTGDGAVALLAMAMTSDAARTGIFGWRSPNGGHTWNETDVASLSGRVGSVYGRAESLGGGRLRVWGMLRKGASLGERGVWTATSEDCGRSWGEPVVISREPLGEPAFTLAGERLVGLLREDGATCYRQCVSDDLGGSWIFSPSKIGCRTRLPSPFIAVSPREPSRLFALQTDRRHDNDCERGGIYLWTSKIGELRWKRIATAVRFPSGAECGERPDFGYPWMIPVGGDEWFLVFYFGRTRGKNSIWGMRLRLSA